MLVAEVDRASLVAQMSLAALIRTTSVSRNAVPTLSKVLWLFSNWSDAGSMSTFLDTPYVIT